MRLQISKSKNAASFYVVKSTYVNGVRSSKIVEKLGTENSLREKLNGKDPYEWAKEYVNNLNKLEKEGKEPAVIAKYLPSKQITKNNQRCFNGGYLFLQKIYHQLNFNNICKQISSNYKFTYDLDSILSRLIFSRIIYPSSKLATFELSKKFIQQPKFDLHQIYRSLDIVSKESDYIQSELYKNSLKISKRNTGVLYYDCTNFFFEIEREEGLKQYGLSKEHRPNPIVQMGLFMDGDGIPLAFNINKGNTNEQITLKPLENQILSDFKLSKFVVCTDAGLASNANRKFNDKEDRAFITTQSLKKLKKHIKEWAFDTDEWMLPNDINLYDISKLDEITDIDKVFFKERWIKENGIEQKLIVSFSLKYRNYQRTIRETQIQRAQKLIDKNPSKLKKNNANDYKRFIDKTNVTPDGEIAKKQVLSIDNSLISKESMYDGFYAVCTNLDDDISEIIKVNKRRWEIEESFRIMKNEFKARPVYLKKDTRIQAHFTICFIALMIFRLLEKKLNSEYTCTQIISCLRDMNFLKVKGEGYIPTYTRNNITDKLHEAFEFRTDYEIVSTKIMKKIFKDTQK